MKGNEGEDFTTSLRALGNFALSYVLGKKVNMPHIPLTRVKIELW
jgi:hypothetical protein